MRFTQKHKMKLCEENVIKGKPLSLNQISTVWYYVILALLLGFFSYGMSLYYYISAQRHIGAARTGAYYAIAPFAGSVFSFIVLGETLSLVFAIAFIIMVFGT